MNIKVSRIWSEKGSRNPARELFKEYGGYIGKEKWFAANIVQKSGKHCKTHRKQRKHKVLLTYPLIVRVILWYGSSAQKDRKDFCLKFPKAKIKNDAR